MTDTPPPATCLPQREPAATGFEMHLSGCLVDLEPPPEELLHRVWTCLHQLPY